VLEIQPNLIQNNALEVPAKESLAFTEFAEKMAQEIAQKMGVRPIYNLAIVAIFQNDSAYLKEWIEYHKLVGIEHFYLFNNLSSDGYLSVLKPYMLNGDVDLIAWPYQTDSEGKNWSSIQRAAYLTAVKLLSGSVKWLAIIDTDEFIVPVESDDLAAVLSEYEEFGGVTANWQMFGTSNIKEIPSDMLLTETLLMKAPQNFPENLHVKSIVRPERVLMCHVHHSVFQPGYFAVDTNKNEMAKARSSIVLVDKIRINHYWSRDEEFFYKTKIPRRKKWQEEERHMFERVNNCNQEIDTSMLRFAPRLRERMEFN